MAANQPKTKNVKRKTENKAKKQEKREIVVAKLDNGDVQITFTIPWKKVKPQWDHSIEEVAKNMQIPGFRKGKAPLNKVLQKADKNELIEHTLQHLVPEYFNEAVKKNDLKPIIYPKIEIIKVQEGEDWQIRALTVEIPVVDLGDYKKAVKGELAAKNIVVNPPAGGDKELSRQEKENIAMEALLSETKVEVPQMLVDQEVDMRLANLLERLENLGLTLESYLASVNKDGKKLREEYVTNATTTLKLEFVLNKIADVEKVEVNDADIAEFAKVSGDENLEKELTNDAQKKNTVVSILKKRKVIDSLVNLG